MAGLFGLFGRKNEDEVKDAYFLTPDESKTFGDIDYMRKSKTVKRTFAKSITGGGGKLIKEVSALKAVKKNANQVGSNNNFVTSSDSGESSFTPDSQKLRSTDTSMNMFRNMAKQIKK